MAYLRVLNLAFFVFMLSACASTPEQRGCVPGETGMQQCPPEGAVDDAKVNADYKLRTWRTPSELKERDFDPVKYGDEAEVPVNNARAKIIGPRFFKNAGLGIALASNSLKVTEDTSDYKFVYDNRINGILIDAVAYF